MKLSLILLFVGVFAIQSVLCASKAEIAALNDLYASAGGPGWYFNSGWTQGDPCVNSWSGVTCNSGHVISVTLSNNGLVGSLPVNLNNLTSIQTFDVSFNSKLGGTIPPVPQWSSAYTLLFNNCQFTGSIPSQISAKDINQLNLSNNRLTGTIPENLGFQFYMKELNLENNQLSGSIPQQLGTLYSLRTLTLQNNQFSGQFPEFLMTQPYDLTFNATNNKFACPLPEYCAAPPVGNGLCAPCFSPPNSIFCCTYSPDECYHRTYSLCVTTDYCPEQKYDFTCQAYPVSSCGQCNKSV